MWNARLEEEPPSLSQSSILFNEEGIDWDMDEYVRILTILLTLQRWLTEVGFIVIRSVIGYQRAIAGSLSTNLSDTNCENSSS